MLKLQPPGIRGIVKEYCRDILCVRRGRGLDLLRHRRSANS